MEENNTTKSTEGITVNESKEKGKQTTTDSEDELLSLMTNLIDFESEIKSLKSMNEILSKENLNFFKKLSIKDNIKLNLLLSKIYMGIISNESLYNEYLLTITENDINKIDILFQLIENCISIIEKLNTFVFSSDLFQLKNKIIDLIKCIYYNCRNKIKDEEKIQKILELMESLPPIFFSSSYLELNKSKDLYEVCRTKEIEKINQFEEIFSEINNYYEQFEAFKKFVENNSGVVNCSSINEESLSLKSEIFDFKPNNDKIDFYEQYGSLLLKFCKYHNYMFLDKEDETNENKVKTDDKKNEEKEEENCRMVFLLDKIEQEKNEDEDDKNKKIENLLKNKQFVSSMESKEYNSLIKKEINCYLKVTKNLDKEAKIKPIREHLSYYLSTLDVESYYPLYLTDFTKISISDNFTPSYITNVPAGQINKFYFETEENEDTLAYIEFSLEDKTKDITFELNKYEINGNKFINIFKEEKIEGIFKFFIFCHGYSLYEMVFDNYYSWFNSKDINYRVSLLKMSENSKKEEENHFHFKINGTNYYFNGNELAIPEKTEKIINIPVVLHLNNLKIVSFKKNENENENENENDKYDYELVIKEHKEEDETIIQKHLFNYLLINYLKKLKIEKDKNEKILISIFSLNKNLLSVLEELKDELEKVNDHEKKTYIKSIGFYPEDKIDRFKLEYKLYEPTTQILIYHLFFNLTKDIKISKFILIIEFDKLIANAVIYNKGEILNKLRDKNINFNDIGNDKVDEILDLIKNVYETFEGMELILVTDSNIDEENKKKLLSTVEKIKTYCQEQINPPVKIFEYDQNEILQNSIKYSNSLYEN